jgi:hypothetical protein
VSNEAFRKTTKIQRTGDSGTRLMCVSGYTSVSASSIHGRTFDICRSASHTIFKYYNSHFFFFFWNFKETYFYSQSIGKSVVILWPKIFLVQLTKHTSFNPTYEYSRVTDTIILYYSGVPETPVHGHLYVLYCLLFYKYL